MGMEQAWLLPALPAAAFAVLLLIRRFLPRQGDWLSVLAIFASFVLFFFVAHDLTTSLAEKGDRFVPVTSGFEWLRVGDFFLRVGFSVDQLTLVMLAVVTIVALLVQVYSLGYMHGAEHYGWYFTAMSLFAAAMLTLVLADNFLLLYVAWEGVGICSYLLIGFYYERRSAVEAAKKAFITTRLGDVGLLTGIILLYRATGSFNMQDVFHQAQAGVMSDGYLTTATILILLGAMGKSAQFPFHVWLPDAMEGPTPVSALIHAATMVVAGVYLVARTMPLFELANGAQLVVVTVGVITIVLSVTMGLAATDIKRVIAYSTLNSLGLMFVALGAGSVTAALFYLLGHGFFKALLFLAAGSIIHSTGRQDVEELGGLWRKMPWTAATFAVGTLAMAGIPPLAGFWAKDEILAATSDQEHFIVFALVGISVFLTALYMARLYILIFLGQPKGQPAYDHAHPSLEGPPVMLGPLLLLAALTVVAGFVVFDGVGEALGFPGGIGKFVFAFEPEPFHFRSLLAAGASVMALLGTLTGFYVWWARPERARAAAEWAPGFYALFKNKYYIDNLYQAAIDRGVLAFSNLIAWFDRHVVNDTGVDGTAELVVYSGDRLKYTETGKLPNYAFLIILGIVVLGFIAFTVRL